MDLSDEALLPKPKSTPKPGNEPPVRRSNRNVGPPKFYGKRYFIDVVDEPQVVSGTALNLIVLDNNISQHSNSTHQSDPSSPDLRSSSSMDESLRIAVDNFDNTNYDSELFNAELENFINCYRKY